MSAWQNPSRDKIPSVWVLLENLNILGLGVSMENMKAGRAVIELLRAEQVDYIFGVTGLTTKDRKSTRLNSSHW